MASGMSFEQIATVLNEINAQAAGNKDIAAIDTASFVAQAQATLKTGQTVVADAISQVLSRTIFSVRPYYAQFQGLMLDSARWGNHVRKLTEVDDPARDDEAWKLTDGASVDQQVFRKPKVLQMNFYGGKVYCRDKSFTRDQLNNAFTGPDELGNFVSMQLQNLSNMVEQDREDLARMALVNFAGAKISKDPTNVFKLLTIYNERNGGSLTPETVRLPENYGPFMLWAFGFIKTVSDKMRRRSEKFHMNVTGKPVKRHTPRDKQKLYMSTEDMNIMNTTVRSNVFNDKYLAELDFELVDFWQDIDKPMSINVTASYIDENGEEHSDAAAQTDNLLGILFDEEAVGITEIDQWTDSAPFNARGGYTTTYWHYNHRYYNDLTENGVVFLME